MKDTTIQEVFHHYRQSPTHDLSLLQSEVQKAFDTRVESLESTMSKVFDILNDVSKESVQQSRDLIYKELINRQSTST